MSKRPGVCLVILSLSLLGACGGQKPHDSAKAANASPEVDVYVVSAGAAPASQGHVIPSALTVEHEADLLAEEEGVLLGVLADQGRRVRRGQVLARLDDSQLRKQLDQDRAEMQSLEVQARQAKLFREAAEVELQRQSDLRKYGLGTQRDYDRARYNLEAAREEIDKVRFDYEKAKAKVAADELRLSRMELKAPFEGIVSRRYARVGQALLRNERVLRVTELRPLLVRFTVPESWRQAARAGESVDVVPAEAPLSAVRARVLRTSYVVDAASGAVECVARLVEPLPEGLVPGMAVNVKITGKDLETAGAIWIPRSAVRMGAGGAGDVYVVDAGQLRKRSLRLGQEASTTVQVISGLAVGEKIVAQATDNLQDGMPVRVRQ